MWPWIQIARPLNLLIMALLMVVLYYAVLLPNFDFDYIVSIQFPLEEWEFLLSVVAVALIAAGGNVINDVLDEKADLINKPNRVIIGKSISKRAGMTYAICLLVTGLVLGLTCSYWANDLNAALIYCFSTLLLIGYSYWFKHWFLIGNVVVSALAGAVPILVITLMLHPEISSNNIGPTATLQGSPGVVLYTSILAVFAFVVTLVRELIKDMADVLGDLEVGSQTAAILMNTITLRVITTALLLFTTFVVGTMAFESRSWSLIAFILLTVVLPLMLASITLNKAKKPDDYNIPSNLLKVAMVAVIIFPVFFPNQVLFNA